MTEEPPRWCGGRRRSHGGGVRLFVFSFPLTHIDAALGVGIIVDIAFHGVLAFQQFGIFAGGEAARRLADAGIAFEIARERAPVSGFSMLRGHPRLQFPAGRGSIKAMLSFWRWNFRSA